MNKRQTMGYLRSLRRNLPVHENLPTIIVWRLDGMKTCGIIYHHSFFQFSLSGRLITKQNKLNPDHKDFALAILHYHRIKINAPA